MHLLMLVSDFAAVMHVQRPEEGPGTPAAHPVSPTAEAPAAPVRSGWGRLLGAMRGTLRRASKSR